ncbi:hypothetical protein WA026_022387 [Henosepilachna vigintioctopunctata]|uniref:Uncharacterized protein n=1 Tax=Henosepilachna vigintioctopunctata TaxID=420089 RepID=A0AAW1UD06_9CUCU
MLKIRPVIYNSKGNDEATKEFFLLKPQANEFIFPNQITIIFNNNSSFKKGKVSTYADDTALDYGNLYQTRFAVTICMVLQYERPLFIQKVNCSEECDSDALEQLYIAKYLGLTFNQNINFKAHIQKVKEKLYTIISRFYFLREIVPISTPHLTYLALVQFVLTYGISIRGGINKTNIKPFLTTQKHLSE